MKKYIRQIKKEIFCRLFFHFIYITSIAGLPIVIKYMIDSDYSNGIYDFIMFTLTFVTLIVVGMIAQYITQRSSWKLNKRFYNLLRADLFSVIIRKEPFDFNNENIGNYNSILNNDVEACKEYINYIMLICESLIGLVVYAVYIFSLKYIIAIVIYIVAVLTLFLPNITGNKLSFKKKELLKMTGEYYSKVIDLLKGYSLVNSKTYKNIENRHNSTLEEMENSRYDFGKFKTFVNVFNGSVMYIINISAFLIIAFLLFKGEIKAGVAAATVAYLEDFMYPLRTIIDAITDVKSVKTVTESVMTEVKDVDNISFEKCGFLNSIKFRNVCFSYESFELKNFSYTFEKNKKYAIIGESGKGKSTILNLLFGNINASCGDIKLDDKSISYRLCNEIMIYVTQDSHIFSEDFLDNVTMYNSFDKNLVDKFLKENIPSSKRDILLNSSDCSKLSGGEKQLVSYLRSLLSEKDIILLDEPFSALDSSLELSVCKNLLSMRDKTIIMVTHNESVEFLSMFDDIMRL